MADPRVPSTEELHQIVEERFRSEHPDAPDPLADWTEEYADWKALWDGVLRDVVNELANRIYWDAHPEAPVVIDPKQASHQRYVTAWKDIHAALEANKPVPAMAKGTPERAIDAGLSEVRAGAYEALADILRVTPAGMHHQLQAAVDWHLMQALGVGRGADDGSENANRYLGYFPEWEWIEFQEPGAAEPWKVHMQFQAWGTENYGVQATIEWSHIDPGIEMEDEVVEEEETYDP